MPDGGQDGFRKPKCLPTMLAGMREVACIEPNGRSPGLVAFLCVECRSTDSILVYPVSGSREVEHTQRREQVEI